MTIKELETLCHQLEFTGNIGDCVINALYCELDQNIYSGPTLIYCPPEHKYVYISPEIEITKCKKGFYYKSVPRELGTTMPEIYTKCELKDDETIIKALTNLKKLWKEQLNNLRLKDIKHDF